MAAKRNFDSDEVIERVMNTFWTHGYRGTSLEDLSRATGLRKGSLHNAFGNKENLFLLAIKRYAEQFDFHPEDALADPDPYRAIERYLNAVIERMSDPANPQGCLSTYACIEWQDLPPKAAAKVAEELAKQEKLLTEIIQRGQQEGKIQAHKNARSLSRFLVSTTRGMAVMHKVTGNINAVKEIANCALSIL